MAVGLNTVNVAGLEKAVELATKTGTTLFVSGSFGLGKTEIVSSTLRELGYEPIDWFRGSTMTPDTIAGIPYLNGGTLDRAVPEIIAACVEAEQLGQRPALVLDELNIATPFMLGAMLQLLLERRLNRFSLPEGTPVIAMGNLEDDGSIVSELPLPAANRMRQILFMGPTFDEWERWAINNQIHPSIISLLRERPDLLCEYHNRTASDAGRTRWATPRTWAMTSMHLEHAGIRDVDEMISLVASLVGDAAAAALNLHLRTSFDLTPLHEILANPDGAKLPDPTNTPACYMQVASIIQGCSPTEDAAKAAMTYVRRMEASWLPVFITMANSRRDFEVALFMAGAAGAMTDDEFDLFSNLDEIRSKISGADAAYAA